MTEFIVRILGVRGWRDFERDQCTKENGGGKFCTELSGFLLGSLGEERQ